MGLAQCDASFRAQRGLFVLLFLGLPLFDIPFANVLRTAMAWALA